MLCLSRKQDEGVTIQNKQTGEVIHLLILDTTTGRVRIGIEASSEWKILRDELVSRRHDKDGAK